MRSLTRVSRHDHASVEAVWHMSALLLGHSDDDGPFPLGPLALPATCARAHLDRHPSIARVLRRETHPQCYAYAYSHAWSFLAEQLRRMPLKCNVTLGMDYLGKPSWCNFTQLTWSDSREGGLDLFTHSFPPSAGQTDRWYPAVAFQAYYKENHLSQLGATPRRVPLAFAVTVLLDVLMRFGTLLTYAYANSPRRVEQIVHMWCYLDVSPILTIQGCTESVQLSLMSLPLFHLFRDRVLFEG
jgi:hypothetical protein